MAPKRNPPPSAVPPSTAAATIGQTSASTNPQHTPTASSVQRSSPGTPSKAGNSTTAKSSLSSSAAPNMRNAQDAQQIVQSIWNRYQADTPQRTKVIDCFMGFLMVVGGLQFVYCVLAGNYPFNAFLSGFSATVGQFVLTASLRMQTNPENKIEFQGRSYERAFADYVLGSLILHFFCVNFIN